MLNSQENGLQIFDNFIIDRSLPKYNKKKVIEMLDGENPMTDNISEIVVNDMNSRGSFISLEQLQRRDGINDRINFTQTPSTSGILTINGIDVSAKLLNQNISWFKRVFSKKDKKIETKKEPDILIPVETFFKHIKNTAEELENIENRLNSYLKLLQQSKSFGQIALVERLEKRLEVIRNETQLYAKGFKKLLTEKNVVDFYKGCEKGVRLIWIKNFARPIPSKFLDIKNELDEIGVFDNYVIMTYDPQGRSYNQTQKEKEEELAKKKDPILFGVMKDSTNLYYIGDWKDDCCDLTLDDIIAKLGEEVINANNLTAEIKINC